MSNLLKVAMIDLIRSLHRQGLSQRQIASELGVNRETVARYLRQAADTSKPAIAPSGSDGDGAESKPAVAPSGSKEKRPSSKPAIAPSGSGDT
jgi:IS30 family transposase